MQAEPQDDYTKELAQAFIQYSEAEQNLAETEKAFKDVEYDFKSRISQQKQAMQNAVTRIEYMMQSVGVVEEVIHGKHCDFKLAFSTPRKSVDVIDVDAVPDEFVKVERKPMKAEITKAFKDAPQLPNWLQWKEGESKLQIKPIKKG